MRIISFGQSIMADRLTEVQHHITVQFDNGMQSVVPVMEETVRVLIELKNSFGSEEGIRHDDRVSPAQMGGPEAELDGPAGIEFEAPIDEGEYAPISEPIMGVMAETPIGISSSRTGGLGQPRSRPRPIVSRDPLIGSDGFQITPRARTVPKNEMGYPIIPKKKVTTPKLVVKRENDEEGDGVQI